MSGSGESGWSLKWMVVVLMLAIVALGWSFAASDYATKVDGTPPGDDLPNTSYRAARGAFLSNALTQIPNVVQVTSHVFSNARWILYIFGGLEVGALFLAIVASRIEGEAAGSGSRYKRRK